MKLGKRTAKLVREAAVAGFVQGTRWAGMPYSRDEAFPLDADILDRAYRCAVKFPECYPTLSKVEEAWEADIAARTRYVAELQYLMTHERPEDA